MHTQTETSKNKFRSGTRIWSIALFFMFVLSACNLPIGPSSLSSNNVQPTLPPAAANGGEPIQLGHAQEETQPTLVQVTLPPLATTATVAASTGASVPSQNSSESSSGNSIPHPTATPQQDTLIGSLAQTPGLAIKSISASQTTIYDGGCSDVGPTSTFFQFELISPDLLNTAQLRFHYLKNGQVIGQDYGHNFTYNGASTFTFDSDSVTNRPDDYLDGAEGQLEYWAAAQDTSGNWVVSDRQYVKVLPCSVVGSPLTPPQINQFIGPSTAYEGDTVKLEWNVSDASCGVYLDGNSVHPNGNFSYVVPANSAPMTLTHSLLAHGGDCANPTTATDTVYINLAIQSVTLSAPIIQSGMYDVDEGNSWYGAIIAGDDEHDHKMTGFVQFDISSLKNNVTELHSATLNLGPCKPIGLPMLTQPFDISAVSSSLGTTSIGTLKDCSGEFNVSGVMFKALGDNSVQFMIRPANVHPGNTADQITYTPTLTIVYTPKP